MKTTKLIYPLALTVALALNFTVRAAGDADTLPPIFNGKDFTGWKCRTQSVLEGGRRRHRGRKR